MSDETKIFTAAPGVGCCSATRRTSSPFPTAATPSPSTAGPTSARPEPALARQGHRQGTEDAYFGMGVGGAGGQNAVRTRSVEHRYVACAGPRVVAGEGVQTRAGAAAGRHAGEDVLRGEGVIGCAVLAGFEVQVVGEIARGVPGYPKIGQVDDVGHVDTGFGGVGEGRTGVDRHDPLFRGEDVHL